MKVSMAHFDSAQWANMLRSLSGVETRVIMTEKNIPGPQKDVPEDVKKLFQDVSDSKRQAENKEKENEAADFAEGRLDFQDPMFNG